MDLKAMLLKLFTNYGISGAKMPSYHGCHEPAVPESLVRIAQDNLHRKQSDACSAGNGERTHVTGEHRAG